jgi:hypothetical protein
MAIGSHGSWPLKIDARNFPAMPILHKKRLRLSGNHSEEDLAKFGYNLGYNHIFEMPPSMIWNLIH